MLALLLLLLIFPIATAGVLLLFMKSLRPGGARWIALASTWGSLIAASVLAANLYTLPTPTPSSSPVQPIIEWRAPWLVFDQGQHPFQLELHLGLDGVSMALVLLSSLLTASSVLIAWSAIRQREAEFYIAVLVLQAGLIGVFTAFDLVLFYAFFEFTLLPALFLITVWGAAHRCQAATKMFLYTMVGSLISLVGLVMLISHAAIEGLQTPSSLPDLALWLQTNPLPETTQITLFLLISAGLLVKIPMMPFHTWQPATYVEAPAAATVLLAGIMSKLGCYGFLRICLPLLPVASSKVGLPLISVLAIVSIIYGSLCALAQRDAKRLIAYSSIAHMGVCMLGLYALNVQGLSGGVLMMLNHGLTTGGLFILVAMIDDRYQSRSLDEIGGLASKLPVLATAMVFMSMASIGLPGLNGFVGEVLTLGGMFERHPLYAVLGTTGIVLGAWYLLTMLQSLLFGPLHTPRTAAKRTLDLGPRELLTIGPIAALCLIIGVYPQPLVDTLRPDIERLSAIYSTPTVESTVNALPATPLLADTIHP